MLRSYRIPKQLTEDAIDPTQQQEQQPQLMEIDVETNQIINEMDLKTMV